MKKIILCFVTLLSIVSLYSQNDKEFTAINFTLPTVDGKFVSLDDYKDKYIVLFFWASWCPYCIQSMSEIKTYSEKYKDNVVFIGINSSDSFSRMKKTIEKYKIENIVNLYDLKSDVGNLYGIPGYPTKLIIFPDRSMVHVGTVADLDQLFK